MSQIKVLIASVLKPINDVRVYEKLGISISKIKGFSVNIFGLNAKIPSDDTINFIIHSSGVQFNSMNRFKAAWEFMKTCYRLKPDIIIISTHELLFLAWFSQLFHKTKLIYDVQENYELNLLDANHYSRLVKPFIRLYIKINEWIAKKFFHGFFLAEKVYASQLGFPQNKSVILENKTLLSKNTSASSRKKNTLLFTGTVAPQTGIYECLEFFQQLTHWNLIIVGYCALPEIRVQIENRIKGDSSIEWIGKDTLVPHEQIISHIQRSSAGFIHYQDIPSIKGKMPTKLYEYLAHELPIIFPKTSHWSEFAEQFHIPFIIGGDAQSTDMSSALGKWVQHQGKQVAPTPKTELSWQSCENDLHAFMKKLYYN